MPDAAKPITVALRFDRRDAPKLRVLAFFAGEDTGAFHKAADSAEVGDPLIIHCRNRQEIEHLADRIQTYGINRPAIDELTNPRPERRS